MRTALVVAVALAACASMAALPVRSEFVVAGATSPVDIVHAADGSAARFGPLDQALQNAGGREVRGPARQRCARSSGRSSGHRGLEEEQLAGDRAGRAHRPLVRIAEAP